MRWHSCHNKDNNKVDDANGGRHISRIKIIKKNLLCKFLKPRLYVIHVRVKMFTRCYFQGCLLSSTKIRSKRNAWKAFCESYNYYYNFIYGSELIEMKI